MKHGRRHNKLKEQAYAARKDAEGYGRPYEPMPLAPPEKVAPPDESEPLALTDILDPKSQKALRRATVRRDDWD